ncbi:MAG: hypothetical protein AAGH73_11575, partial [Pseudomonadota bacterium]
DVGGQRGVGLRAGGDLREIEPLHGVDIGCLGVGVGDGRDVGAMERLDLAQVSTRAEADAALAADVSEAPIRAFLLQSLDVKARAWKLNLPTLRAGMDEIIGFPETAARWDGRALFLSGALSDYVTREARPAIKARFPGARFAKIPGAGHWLHAEKPREFEAAVTTFLESP